MDFKRIISAVKSRGYKYINERRGWTTDRKIVVIESDDWGSIRMPSREVYERSLKAGIRIDKCTYGKYDTMASEDDLTALYDILRKHKDVNGNHPVITANAVMANPDFDKIRATQFKEYHFELFTETLKRYPKRNFDLWKQGIDEKLFYPQLHGREHLNVDRWLRILQNNSKEMHFAFDNNYFGISKTISNENNPSFMAALDYDNEKGKKIALEATNQSADIFEKIFGFKSKTFIAPNYIWDKSIEKVLKENNINFLQGSFCQNIPHSSIVFHFLGEQNKNGQTYLTRNVIFEPSSNTNKSWIGSALSEINKSFSLKKPAILCSHRVNFIGSICEDNRTKNLEMLDLLLVEIIMSHPTVEFMHSAQLSEIIQQSNK